MKWTRRVAGRVCVQGAKMNWTWTWTSGRRASWGERRGRYAKRRAVRHLCGRVLGGVAAAASGARIAAGSRHVRRGSRTRPATPTGVPAWRRCSASHKVGDGLWLLGGRGGAAARRSRGYQAEVEKSNFRMTHQQRNFGRDWPDRRQTTAQPRVRRHLHQNQRARVPSILTPFPATCQKGLRKRAARGATKYPLPKNAHLAAPARAAHGGARARRSASHAPRRRRAATKKPMRTLAPDARTDIVNSHKQGKITTMATTMNAIADAIQPSALEALLTQTLADEAGLNDVAEGFKPILAYVASLASNQCVAETFHMFEWEKTCKAYLTPILADEEKCAAVTKKFMDESEKRVPKREVELDIPEGEGEILCNVEFKPPTAARSCSTRRTSTCAAAASTASSATTAAASPRSCAPSRPARSRASPAPRSS